MIFVSKFILMWTKISAWGADRRRRREKLGILAISAVKFNLIKQKKLYFPPKVGVITTITPPPNCGSGYFLYKLVNKQAFSRAEGARENFCPLCPIFMELHRVCDR